MITLATYTNDIEHTLLEIMIYNEQLYRDTLIEQTKAMYPGLKYKEPEILQESLDVSKSVIIAFFSQYKTNIGNQFTSCISKLKTLYSEYSSISDIDIDACKRDKKLDARPTEKYTLYTYDFSIPNMRPLIDEICEIKTNYNICLMANNDNIKKKIHNIQKTNNRDIAKICGSDNCPSSVISYMRSHLRNNNDPIYFGNPYDFTEKYILGQKKNFSSYISSISKITDKYLAYIALIEKNFKEHVISLKIDPNAIIDLSYSDGENIFYRYELAKLSKLLNAVTDIISTTIIVISENIQRNIDFIKSMCIDNI